MSEAVRSSIQSLLLSVLLSSCTLQAFAYYHPDDGRWLSRDPIGAEGGPNEYAFARNAPVDRIDDLGLSDCLSSQYNYIEQRPLKDRDIWTRQTLTVNTRYYVGPYSTTITRSRSYQRLYGLTVTEPSVVGGDCCCATDGNFKPFFELTVHSQIYLLDKRASAWDVENISTGDSHIDPYWYYSPEWYRRHLVMNHERAHQAHGEKNYKKWKDELTMYEANRFSSYSDCLVGVAAELNSSWGTFNTSQAADSAAVETGQY